ncbi:MAG: flagellar protein FliS, partial [Oscillospiraceae bacterium]|nr:flagellar protein FliS [Oscillospiraceae bacterium]
KELAVDTMTQGELLMMLYDELVKRLTRADIALAKQEYTIFEASVDRSMDIIHYLDDTLDRQYEISHSLTRLYEYFCYELNRVKLGRNKTELTRVKTMVSELRESFRTAQQSNTSGK